MIARVVAQLVAVVALPLVFLGVVEQVGAALAGRRGLRLLRPVHALRRSLGRGGAGRLVGLLGLSAATLACAIAPLLGPRPPLGFPGDVAVFVGLLVLVRRCAGGPTIHVPLALVAGAPIGVGLGRSVAALAGDPPAALACAGALLLMLRVTAAEFAAGGAELSLEDGPDDAAALDRPLARHTAGVTATALAGQLAALVQPTPLASPWFAAGLHVALIVGVAALVGVVEARLAPLRPRAAPLYLAGASLLGAAAVLLSARGGG